MSENLTTDKIAEIRAKLISNRRTRIKPEDEDSKTQSMVLGDLEVRLFYRLTSPVRFPCVTANFEQPKTWDEMFFAAQIWPAILDNWAEIHQTFQVYFFIGKVPIKS